MQFPPPFLPALNSSPPSLRCPTLAFRLRQFSINRENARGKGEAQKKGVAEGIQKSFHLRQMRQRGGTRPATLFPRQTTSFPLRPKALNRYSRNGAQRQRFRSIDEGMRAPSATSAGLAPSFKLLSLVLTLSPSPPIRSSFVAGSSSALPTPSSPRPAGSAASSSTFDFPPSPFPRPSFPRLIRLGRISLTTFDILDTSPTLRFYHAFRPFRPPLRRVPPHRS